MPLLFFDVPILWSPIIPPFRFKIIGFFVALKQPAIPAVAASSSDIKHPASGCRLRQHPHQCAGFKIETLLVGSPLFGGEKRLLTAPLSSPPAGCSLMAHPIILLYAITSWYSSGGSAGIVPHESRDHLIHLFYFFFNFN